MILPARDASGIKWRYYVKAVDRITTINVVNANNTMKRKTDSQLRSEAYERETMKRKENPTIEESKLALKAQSPIDESRHESLQVTSFKQLAKAATSARTVFGGNGQWIKADDMFRDDYRNGLESPVFVITKAFTYESIKLGSRMGIEIVMSNKQVYNIGFPFKDSDSKRVALIDAFHGKSGVMLGPVRLVKLDLGQMHPYYDLQPADATGEIAPIDIPFEEIEFDKDIPF